MDVLTVDVGGSHVKILSTGHAEPQNFVSGPKLTPARMVAGVKKLAADWKYDVVSLGYPGPVLHGKPVAEPHNLGSGWVGFDYQAAFGCPVKLINDAAMQALGSYGGGKMLFLGLGTGLGTALIVDGIVEPMEVGHLPYKKATYEDYVGLRGLKRFGRRKWRNYVADVAERLIAALEPDYTVLGGGNVEQLKELPTGCRAGDSSDAFLGGFRLWDQATSRIPSARHKRRECVTPKAEGAAAIKLGYDSPLYILPFDHRGSFETKMFGWTGELTAAQAAEITDAKEVIYDGFKMGVAQRLLKDNAGVLVDEQFGTVILRDAVEQGFITACAAEKSGQEEFDFEYGEEFVQHLEALHPTFCKVLVRYNPEGDRALNNRQTERLKRLSDYLHDRSRSRFMFELLVPAEKLQLDRVQGDKRAYDVTLRPGLMVQAIEQLQDAGVEPDLWKIEGLERREDCAKIVATARRRGRDKVSCIVLGRGEDETKVHEWLSIAASVPGFIGFAVGRTVFWEPLVGWREKRNTREDAVAEIARRYRKFADTFEKSRTS